ncbi:MAG TPA: 2-amino-4-hydroxy-6-hydroxymethyldihydropteridine diphosphokinase [Vicinamibacterales bacterium]|nr:2-amino-4-hydroxy-6-hydroxymethyldihydropteridine diphosphokinase [Vicinamibacterales bacterium]
MTSRVAIAIGSNLGNRDAAIAFAVSRLSGIISDLRASAVIETWPVGEGTDEQNLYLNAVVVGETVLGARQLLEALLGIEAAFGRERPFRNAPRTLDLDLILLGDAVVVESDLEVPHPRFRERFFVLGPLAELAPEMVDPVSGMTVGQLLRALLRDETR